MEPLYAREDQAVHTPNAKNGSDGHMSAMLFQNPVFASPVVDMRSPKPQPMSLSPVLPFHATQRSAARPGLARPSMAGHGRGRRDTAQPPYGARANRIVHPSPPRPSPPPVKNGPGPRPANRGGPGPNPSGTGTDAEACADRPGREANERDVGPTGARSQRRPRYRARLATAPAATPASASAPSTAPRPARTRRPPGRRASRGRARRTRA